MRIDQTGFFNDDIKHYYKLAKDHLYTSRKDDIRKSLYKLETVRGAAYCDKLAAKINQKLKKRYYFRENNAAGNI